MISYHLADDRVDAGRVGARDHHHDRHPGRRDGALFTPIQVLAFVTLAPSMRTEGAALFSLLRNLGAAIGARSRASVLARNTQVMHELIGASVTPFNRALQAVGPMHQWLDPATGHGAAIARPPRQPAGADSRLCKPLCAADRGDRAGVAAASDDAAATPGDQHGRRLIVPLRQRRPIRAQGLRP